MPAARQPFEPAEQSGARTVRIGLGLIVSLGLIAAMVAYFFITPTVIAPELPVQTAPYRLYLSALSGRFALVVDEETEEEIALGQNLRSGVLYRTGRGSLALLRSTVQDLEVVVQPDSTISVGGSLDPAQMTLIGGGFDLKIRNMAGGMGLSLAGTRVQTSSSCSASFARKGETLEMDVRAGTVNLQLGEQEATLRAGDKGRVKEGTIDVQQGLALDAPVLLSPASGSIMRKSLEQPLLVDLGWGEVQDASAYRLEIASDVLFQRMLAQRNTTDTRFTLADVPQGMYYWRVTALGRGGHTGESSDPSSFSVQLMVNPEDEIVSAPELVITEATAQSNIISLRGRTEPGAQVVVHLEMFGRPLSEPRTILVNPTGSFRVQLTSTERGELTVVAQAYYRPEFTTEKTATVFVDF